MPATDIRRIYAVEEVSVRSVPLTQVFQQKQLHGPYMIVPRQHLRTLGGFESCKWDTGA